MKQEEMAVVCLYAEEGEDIAQIIKSSFCIFLEREFSHMENACYSDL